MSTILSKPLTLPCGAVLSNRLAKSAIQDGLATPLGHASEANCNLYRQWSMGGAGLLITGDVMVDYSHRERPGNIVVDGNGGIAELKKWAQAGRTAGNHLWMQINQPGRQTPVDILANPMAPSATNAGLPEEGFGMPREMTEDEILDLIRRYGEVAAIARETGFTGVQLHAAHGFMASSFLSPLANLRNDDWGGSLENRARFMIESLRAMRRAVGDDFPLSVKMNSADFQKGGFEVDESIKVIAMLNAESVDLLEISGGNYSAPAMIGAGSDHPHAREKAQSTLRREAYFRDYAAKARPVAKMPLMMTGGFRMLGNMEEAVASGDADVIGFARPFCVSTDFCKGLLNGDISEAPMVEEKLLLDKKIYGQGLSDREFNLLESYHQLSWMYLQLVRLGNGLEVDWNMAVETAPDHFVASEYAREQARLAAMAKQVAVPA
ncbi:MAG: NADH:flavin oxidoreductase/NADH oxidase family protein [Porticoccaceae bacterium]